MGLLVLKQLNRGADMVVPWTVSVTFGIVLGAGAQMLATGGCRGGLGEKRLGLPYDEHSRFQPLQQTHCTAQLAPQPRQWHLWESVFKKGLNAVQKL